MFFKKKSQYCNYQTQAWLCKNIENTLSLKQISFHFLTVGFIEPIPDISLNDAITENVTMEKVLGIFINKKISFKLFFKKIKNIQKC